MIEQQNNIISSYLGWWHDAGLVESVGDSAQSWLQRDATDAGPVATARRSPSVTSQRPSTAVPATTARVVAQPATRAEPMPDSLEAFDLWLRGPNSLPYGHWSVRPVLPCGPANPEIMLLSDFPDDDDQTDQRLFSGEQGEMITAMLAAIGVDSSVQRHASIAFTRPPTRRLAVGEAQSLMAIARHHIALVQPTALLLLGQEGCRLVTSLSAIPAPENQPIFNHNGGNMSVFAIHHPRTLIERPQTKRHAWETLKRLRELF